MSIKTYRTQAPIVVLTQKSGMDGVGVINNKDGFQISYDDALYEIADGATVAEALKAIVAKAPDRVEGTPLEQARAAKLLQLNQWWDEHPGIEVLPGIVLPIDEAKMAINATSASRAIERGVEAHLIDVNDLTVVVPADKVSEAFDTFELLLAPISKRWDELLRALRGAESIEEVYAIKVYE